MKADYNTYLSELLDKLPIQYQGEKRLDIVCHGHSVPAGYFATPFVNTFEAYPHLLHRLIKSRFPFAVVNVTVTAIGGETAVSGAERFEDDVLCRKPDIVTLDYSLNDRGTGLEIADKAWRFMIERSLERNIKVILLTPSWDISYYDRSQQWKELEKHCCQVRALADEYSVGLADSFTVYERAITQGVSLQSMLSHVNHPSAKAHMLIAEELGRYFQAR